MRNRLIWLCLGVILGSFCQRPALAQQAVNMWGVLNTALNTTRDPQPVAVDSSGVVQVKGQ